MSQTKDFSVSISSRHEELSDSLKESITSQMQKLSRYHNKIIDANILVDKHNATFKVDVSVQLPGSVITACHEDYNQSVALDAALDKTKTRIKKLKERIVDHRAPQVSIAEKPEDLEDNEDIEESISTE